MEFNLKIIGPQDFRLNQKTFHGNTPTFLLSIRALSLFM